jgi:hypothetical protein
VLSNEWPLCAWYFSTKSILIPATIFSNQVLILPGQLMLCACVAWTHPTNFIHVIHAHPQLDTTSYMSVIAYGMPCSVMRQLFHELYTLYILPGASSSSSRCLWLCQTCELAHELTYIHTNRGVELKLKESKFARTSNFFEGLANLEGKCVFLCFEFVGEFEHNRTRVTISWGRPTQSWDNIVKDISQEDIHDLRSFDKWFEYHLLSDIKWYS